MVFLSVGPFAVRFIGGALLLLLVWSWFEWVGELSIKLILVLLYALSVFTRGGIVSISKHIIRSSSGRPTTRTAIRLLSLPSDTCTTNVTDDGGN